MDASVIVALILGLSSVVTSVIFGYIPRMRKEKLIQHKKELLELYSDIYKFREQKKILVDLLKMNGIKLPKYGVQLKTSERSEAARVEKSIQRLESQLK